MLELFQVGQMIVWAQGTTPNCFIQFVYDFRVCTTLPCL